MKAATKRAPFRYTVGEMVPDVYDNVESRVIAEARSFMDAGNICFALNAREEGR